MRLTDYLDKGASLGPGAPCLTMNGRTRSYAEVQRLSWLVGRALARSGIEPGDKVAVLAGNDPVAFACVFGIARAGAIWCQVDLGDEPVRTRELLALLDCSCVIFQRAFAPLVALISAGLPGLKAVVCLDNGEQSLRPAGTVPFRDWLHGLDRDAVGAELDRSAGEVAVIARAGGASGRARAAMLTGHNIVAMTGLTLMSYPFSSRPVYLALAPLTQLAGLLPFPVMTLGGQIIVMREPDLDELLALIGQYQVTHAFLPPALIAALLDRPALRRADLSSLQCFWYGPDSMPSASLATAVDTIGPVMGRLFGQAEAPMVISSMAPADHFRGDGSKALERYSSAGRPTALTTVAIMDQRGALLPAGERGDVVVRSPLVMAGYYRDPAATAEASRHGWYHTGYVGHLDADNYLYLVGGPADAVASGAKSSGRGRSRRGRSSRGRDGEGRA
jgi:fatty-acyl-CoA synthase